MINYRYIFEVEPNTCSDGLNDTKGFCSVLFVKPGGREEWHEM